MDDKLLLRYSRQILLPEIDLEGQQRLIDSSALIMGLGGLGSPVAMYLGAAGIGRLVLVDFDSVELSNLQRQIIHRSDDLGRPKVESARDAIAALNPWVEVEVIDRRLDQAALNETVASVDAVIDATDNFEARFAINESCFRTAKPLISGAAIRFEGQVSVFFPGQGESPCYRCLYADGRELAQTCTETGVVAPLLGMIGSVQAMETLKVLMRIGNVLEGRLLLLDALQMEWQTMRFRRDPECPLCGSGAP